MMLQLIVIVNEIEPIAVTKSEIISQIILNFHYIMMAAYMEKYFKEVSND